MAYSTSNPPRQIGAGGITTNSGPKLWVYSSPDPIATVQAANYFANGVQLGMAVGDMVIVFDSNLGRMYFPFVASLTPDAANNAATNAQYKGSGTGSASLNTTTTASST